MLYYIESIDIHMKELSEIVELLSDRNLSHVARKTGLSYMTVWRVKEGRAINICYDTLSRLSDYFEENL